MLKDFDGWKDLTIDFELDNHQRAVLAGTVNQEWFEIVQKLFEDEVRRFQLLLINTPAEEKEKVMTRFFLAKAAGMLFKGVFERIYTEVGVQKLLDQGIGTISNPEKPTLMPEFEETTPEQYTDEI